MFDNPRIHGGPEIFEPTRCLNHPADAIDTAAIPVRGIIGDLVTMEGPGAQNACYMQNQLIFQLAKQQMTMQLVRQETTIQQMKSGWSDSSSK